MTIERPMFPRATDSRRTAITEQESTRARAEYYFDLEQPIRELAVMTAILTTICQSPPVMPPGIKHADMVDFLIGRLDIMTQDVFGNYRDRLEETAVLS
jgi:hypothetical protein